MNNMLSLEEVKSYLDIDQDEIEKNLKHGRLHAYKIGGTYLRFRKEEVLNLRLELQGKKNKVMSRPAFLARVGDFWRFNNFYIVSLLLVVAIVWVVVKM